jgi:hypothetical protein
VRAKTWRSLTSPSPRDPAGKAPGRPVAARAPCPLPLGAIGYCRHGSGHPERLCSPLSGRLTALPPCPAMQAQHWPVAVHCPATYIRLQTHSCTKWRRGTLCTPIFLDQTVVIGIASVPVMGCMALVMGVRGTKSRWQVLAGRGETKVYRVTVSYRAPCHHTQIHEFWSVGTIVLL